MDGPEAGSSGHNLAQPSCGQLSGMAEQRLGEAALCEGVRAHQTEKFIMLSC